MEPVIEIAHWWPCACPKCVSRLRRLEKTLSILRCIHFIVDLMLKYVSNINEGTWLLLLFYFIVKIGSVASVFAMSFISCVSGFRLKFSFIALWRKRLKLESKRDLTTNGLFGVFCLKMASFVDFIYIDWNLQEMLNCYSFLTTSKVLMFSLTGSLVCSLKMLVIFSHRFL